MRVRLLVAAGAWLLALWWLWMLLVGDWNSYEWIGGAVASAVATAVALGVWRSGGLPMRVAPSIIWRARTALPMVVVDFAIVMVALGLSLVRRRPVRGEFRANQLPLAGTDVDAVGGRVFVTYMTNLAPNAIVVDVGEDGVALVHDLIPLRASEEPAA